MPTAFDFRGRMVVVTGATRGIGKSLADQYAAAGADLLMTGTSRLHVAARNKSLLERGVSNARFTIVDFDDSGSVASFLRELEELPRLDVLVNNAGINRVAPVDEVEWEDFRSIHSVNLAAPFRCAQVAALRMKAQGYGRILNIGSIWSVISKPGRAAYTAAKSGLAGLTRGLAADLAPFGILVNTLSPGFTRTELTASTLGEAAYQSLQEQVPLGRFAEPVELAQVALFLTSDTNSYLTGQNVVVDGGFSIV